MIRDLKDPRVDLLVDRHAFYWRNGGPGTAAPAATAASRPLFQFHPASPLTGSVETRYLEPPPLLEPASFKAGVERTYDEHGLLADDLIRMVGTGITSEVLVGCRVAIRAGTHWAEPAFQDWRQFDGFRVQDTAWYRRLMENTQRAVDSVAGDRYPFCCMAFRGAVDMAEALMTGERLCAAVIDHPRPLKDLLARITDIIIQTALAHSDLLPRFRGGQFNSYGLWTPGRTVTFTVDGGCLFSPAVYEEFFLPCDQRLCAAFETPFVHLHAASRQHFPAWTEIPNLGLQCVIDQAWLPAGRNHPIGPQFIELLPAFQAIRGRKSLMLYGFWDPDLLAKAAELLPAGGSAIVGMVAQPGEMRQRFLQPSLIS
jgi:hypothetical protein